MPELCLPNCPSVLDVTQDAVYAMLSDFLAEMAEVFVDPVLMLGGDEVAMKCGGASAAFANDPAAAARLLKLGINASSATDYFWKRVTTQVMQSAPLKNKTLQIWYCPDCHSGDPPLQQMPKETVADVWGWAPEFGGRNGFPPPEKHELVLSIEMGCADTVPFQSKPNTPF